MNPLYLGTQNRRIFAIHEPPAARRERQRAAVLCYPWGQEYVYAHRTMRQLATKLSSCGFHTLRFDFYGTGDSGGDMAEADLAGWQADTAIAIEGICEIADVARVTLIGLRLGATIAASAAAQRQSTCESLVLWDPIVSGKEYMNELRAGSPATPHDDADRVELQGFAVSSRLTGEIEQIDLNALLAAPPARALMLVTEHADLPDAVRPERSSATGTHSLHREYLESPHPWVEAVSTAGIVPVRVIQRITEWLA